MSGPIQTLPQGLLGLLQLKQTGRNPPVLLDSVQPTFELFDLYAQSRLFDSVQTFGSHPSKNVNAAGSNAFAGVTVVPAGQAWYVYHYTLKCSLLAAEYIRFQPCMFPGPASLDLLILGPDYNDVLTARARFACCGSTQPFWLGPGASLGFNVYDIITAGNIAVDASVRAVVMQL